MGVCYNITAVISLSIVRSLTFWLLNTAVWAPKCPYPFCCHTCLYMHMYVCVCVTFRPLALRVLIVSAILLSSFIAFGMFVCCFVCATLGRYYATLTRQRRIKPLYGRQSAKCTNQDVPQCGYNNSPFISLFGGEHQYEFECTSTQRNIQTQGHIVRRRGRWWCLYGRHFAAACHRDTQCHGQGNISLFLYMCVCV